MQAAVKKYQNSGEAGRSKRAEEKHAEDARRKANRDKWDVETANIKHVLLSGEKPLLTNIQKLTLNHFKTYLLKHDHGFLCPAVKKVWKCAFPDQSFKSCLVFHARVFHQKKITHNPIFLFFINNFLGDGMS